MTDTISDDRDRLIHILVVHFDMFRDKAEDAADLFLHHKTLASRHQEPGNEPAEWQPPIETQVEDFLDVFTGELREEYELEAGQTLHWQCLFNSLKKKLAPELLRLRAASLPKEPAPVVTDEMLIAVATLYGNYIPGHGWTGFGPTPEQITASLQKQESGE